METTERKNVILWELFDNKKKEKPLEGQITSVYRKMQSTPIDSPEYESLLKTLERLTTLKVQERPKRVSQDTKWQVVGALCGVGLLWILENQQIISMRQFSWIKPPNR